MKMVIQERTYTRQIPTFITRDGKVFDDFESAHKHELETFEPRDIWRRKLFLCTLDSTATIYYFSSSEDYEYIVITELDNNVDEGEYKDPGFYLIIRNDGGDYADTYTMMPLSDYTRELENDLNEIKRLTSSKIMI